MSGPREMRGVEGDGPAPRAGDVAAPGRQLTRRAVLGGLAAGGLTAGVVGSLLAACSDGPGSDASPPADAEGAIVRIGRRYRTEHPDEDDRDVLLDRLGLEAGALGPASSLSTLDAQITEDYGSGRTVRLDGWVLSVTEGRAAALVSLV